MARVPSFRAIPEVPEARVSHHVAVVHGALEDRVAIHLEALAALGVHVEEEALARADEARAEPLGLLAEQWDQRAQRTSGGSFRACRTRRGRP